MIKKTINKIVIYVGIFLMLGIMIFPNLREIIGDLVGFFLNPVLESLPLHMIIFILASITGLYAAIVQKYTMDWELMRRVQERMKAMQQEFKQAQVANNPQKMKKIEAQRAEMMSEQLEMTKQQFKPMLYISIISIPLFFWAFTIVTPPNFSWDDVSADDNGKLVDFLEKTVGAEWAKMASIEKSDGGNVITVSDGINLISLTLNEEKTKVSLRDDSGSTQEFEVKMEGGKTNAYAKGASMVFPFWGEKELNDNLWGPFQYWLFWYFICSIPISQMTRKSLNIGGM